MENHHRIPVTATIDIKQATVAYDAKTRYRTSADRTKAVAIGMFVLALIEGVALVALIPLKEYIPYGVTVNEATGEALSKMANSQAYRASDKTKEWLLGRWVKATFAIVPDYTSDELHPWAQGVLRGAAVEEWSQLMEKVAYAEELKRDPSFRRSVKDVAVNLTARTADLSVVTFVTVDNRAGQTKPVVKRWIIQIEFVQSTPKSKEEIDFNPSGLYITHFVLQESK